jgi:hypothetical protein
LLGIEFWSGYRGALDLRHVLMPVGAISQRRDEERIVLPLTPGTERLLLDGERFVGLHAIYASPEDVRRLCCGEDETITTASHGFAGVSPTGRRCTLAIGGHDEHEDLATGVKWSARPNPLEHLRARAAAFVSQPVCADCDKPAEIELLARCGAQQRLLKRCGCGEKVITVADRDVAALPSPAIEWRNGSASLGQSQAHVLRDGDVYRWQVNHLGLRIRDGVESRTFDAHAAAGRILFAVHEATPSIEWLAKFFGLLFRIHDSTPAAMRAKQEAPLVALVAAVPEGLDPIVNDLTPPPVILSRLDAIARQFL